MLGVWSELSMVKKADNSRGRVFYVDDETAVCAAVKETLEQSHISVESFTHPAECLARLRQARCDVLITDLEMPEKDGMELLKEARDMASWIPVMIVTGYGGIPAAVKAIKGGAVDFIEKPLGKNGFVQKIKRLLEQSQTIPMSGFRSLTTMEAKVLKLIVNGKSNTEIAAAINRSVRTVEAHRRGLMSKLRVHNLMELLKLAAVVGMVEHRAESVPADNALPVDDRRGDTGQTGKRHDFTGLSKRRSA